MDKMDITEEEESLELLGIVFISSSSTFHFFFFFFFFHAASLLPLNCFDRQTYCKRLLDFYFAVAICAWWPANIFSILCKQKIFILMERLPML